jgi:hypothetical protein
MTKARVVNQVPVDRFESTFIVSLDPTKGDFTSLQAAINALPASGGKIFVKAGVYKITNTIQIKASNIHIQGEGMGITVFVADSAMTGNTPALEAFSTASDGTARALVADTARGRTTIQTSPVDASSFAAADYILLYSNKSVDTEVPAKHAGEVKQIVAVDPTTGVLTMDDQIFDAYTQADLAAVQLTNAGRILISSNNIAANPQADVIAMLGKSDDWRIVGNHFSRGGSVTLAGAGSVVVDNFGYNPVGTVSNPWPSSGTDLTNRVASGQAVPQSSTVYTVRHTPKTIVVRGGDVFQIRINGTDAGSTEGAFKLGVGETIAITYNTPPPATLVFAE